MKKVLIIVFISLFTLSANAQHVFENKDFMLNTGIGLFGYDGWFPSINVSGEYGAIPTGDVGLVAFGAIMAYKYSSYSWDSYSYDNNYHQFVIGPRGIWHLHVFESNKWDAYAGVGFGLRIWSEFVYNSDSGSIDKKAKVSPYGEMFVGGRMMISESFGLFAEVGYGTLSATKFGVTFSF